MDHQKIVVILDDSAVSAYKAAEATLKAALGSNWTITRLTGSQFRDMPLEEDIFTTSVTCHSAEKEGDLKKGYYFCGGTPPMHSELSKKAVEFVQAQGHSAVWIDTSGDNFKGIEETIADFETSMSASADKPVAPPVTKLARKPKVVNLYIVGTNGPSVTNGSGVPISKLVDEMEARGGRIYEFFQRHQSVTEIEAVIAEASLELRAPDRHPETQTVVVCSQEWKQVYDETKLINAIESLIQDNMALGMHRNGGRTAIYVTDDRAASSAEVGVIYDSISEALLHNLPKLHLKNDELAKARLSLQQAKEHLNGLGMALSMMGQPAPQRGQHQPSRHLDGTGLYRTHGVEGPQPFNGNPGAFEFQRNGARFGDFTGVDFAHQQQRYFGIQDQARQFAFQQNGARFGDFVPQQPLIASFQGIAVLHTFFDDADKVLSPDVRHAIQQRFQHANFTVMSYPEDTAPNQIRIKLKELNKYGDHPMIHVIMVPPNSMQGMTLSNYTHQAIHEAGHPVIYLPRESFTNIEVLMTAFEQAFSIHALARVPQPVYRNYRPTPPQF